MVVKLISWWDPEYDNLHVPISNNFFYIHGDLEEWCKDKFNCSVDADKCDFTELPKNFISHVNLYPMPILEGEFDVELHDCPFPCKAFFYYNLETGVTVNNERDVLFPFLRGYVVKADDVEAVELAKKIMKEKCLVI